MKEIKIGNQIWMAENLNLETMFLWNRWISIWIKDPYWRFSKWFLLVFITCRRQRIYRI